ncbi:MAG: SUMF1/EgtB/PvdO family nonheme iron enzyme [Bryobacterales bacterium]|nr:SUMF1/EgtB/PvdO family nonheme iron enzyme [Bryobacterales bacterium]
MTRLILVLSSLSLAPAIHGQTARLTLEDLGEMICRESDPDRRTTAGSDTSDPWDAVIRQIRVRGTSGEPLTVPEFASFLQKSRCRERVSNAFQKEFRFFFNTYRDAGVRFSLSEPSKLAVRPGGNAILTWSVPDGSRMSLKECDFIPKLEVRSCEGREEDVAPSGRKKIEDVHRERTYILSYRSNSQGEGSARVDLRLIEIRAEAAGHIVRKGLLDFWAKLRIKDGQLDWNRVAAAIVKRSVTLSAVKEFREDAPINVAGFTSLAALMSKYARDYEPRMKPTEINMQDLDLMMRVGGRTPLFEMAFRELGYCIVDYKQQVFQELLSEYTTLEEAADSAKRLSEWACKSREQASSAPQPPPPTCSPKAPPGDRCVPFAYVPPTPTNNGAVYGKCEFSLLVDDSVTITLNEDGAFYRFVGQEPRWNRKEMSCNAPFRPLVGHAKFRLHYLNEERQQMPAVKVDASITSKDVVVTLKEDGPGPQHAKFSITWMEAAPRWSMEVNPADQQTYVKVPAGTFQMGCSTDESCPPSEARREVSVNSFWLGVAETSNGAFQKFDPSFAGAPSNLPVVSVSWDQANAFCSAIGGRLPTEVEWEYAARAGITAQKEVDWDQINYAGRLFGSSARSKGPVASGAVLPNAFGLYHTLGNVMEWVHDSWAPRDRVDRGGAFDKPKNLVRFAHRDHNTPTSRHPNLGFRCVWNRPTP